MEASTAAGTKGAAANGAAGANGNGNGTHHDDGEAEAPAMVMEGNGQLSFKIGGKQPTGSSLRIVGGRVEVNGEFAKGDVVRVELVLRVDEIAFVDDVDVKTRQVVGCERRHKARVIQAPRILTDAPS